MDDKFNDEDEDISIDFSGIKKFFKKDKDTVKSEIKDTKQDIQQKVEQDKQDIKHHKEEEFILKEDIKKKEEHLDELKTEERKLSSHPEKAEQVHKRVEKIEDEETEDDISLDFSKIKGFFKSSVKKHKEEDDDEISFDYNKAISFVQKHKLILLLLIPIFFSIFLRIQPAYLPITEDWADDTLDNYLRNSISSQINQQYPNLPAANRNTQIELELKKVKKEQKDMLGQQRNAIQDQFRSQFQDENGKTYLLAIDPYFWLRHTQNVVDHGHSGDSIKNGQTWNDFMIAPKGRAVPHDMGHAYVTAYTYKILHIFNGDLNVKDVAFMMPILISTLAIIPAFFIGRKLAGNLGGVIAGIILAVHPSFLSRTAGGFADTDAYNILIPLLIAWMFLLAFDSKNLKSRIGFTALAGLFAGFYSFVWGGWWYILAFVFAALGIQFLYELIAGIMNKNQTIPALLKSTSFVQIYQLAITFFVSTGIISSLLIGFNIFISLFTAPFGFIRIKDTGVASVWPNVITTVAEQNEINFSGIIHSVGGKFLLLLAIIGIIIMITARSKNNKKNVVYASLFAVWLFATLYASTKGVRWTLLAVPPISLGLGVCLSKGYSFIAEWASKELKIKKVITQAALILIIVLIILTPIKSGLATSKVEIPSMNDGWYDALSAIDDSAAENSIINSWWDFGHWFKAIGNRPVTFDGASQNKPMAHWIGRTLQTPDEKSAIGILRMLDCGSNDAFEELDKIINKPYKTVDILYEIITMDKKPAARKLVEYGLDTKQATKVISLTHCSDLPENYFITSDDMIGKSGVWAHFGLWDFERATILNKVRSMNKANAITYLQNEFNMTNTEASELYTEVRLLGVGREANTWVSPWPGYASGLTGCSMESDYVKCDNGLEVDLPTMEAKLFTANGERHPHTLSYVDGDKIVEKEFTTDLIDGEISAALIPTSSGYQSVLMNKQLAASMFTILYYFDGHGLEHFDHFKTTNTITGGKIIVWKVDWEGKDMRTMGAIEARIRNAEEIRAAHILLNSSEEAEELLVQINKGADFTLLAKQNSIGPSAPDGGDLGYFKRGEMVPPFEQAAFALEIGEISDVVETQFGFHIIKLIDKRNLYLEDNEK